MRVTIFGIGYVGLVTGTCLAEAGNDVVCVDVDAARVEALRRGEIPIYEPGLEPLVLGNHRAGRLRFTLDAGEGIDHAEIIFIAVGTPPDEDGSADLRHVLEVARTIGRELSHPVVVVDKSTVPVGTAEKVRAEIAAGLAARGAEVEFHVVSNPEFLKEGAAVQDFMRPDRVVLGADEPAALEPLRRLYAPFIRNRDRIIAMDLRSAELTKYAANAMLATKISFMNEIASIAEQVGADVEMVRQGIGSDARIGWHFIYPGAGYGGSCFPKDVQALVRTAERAGHQPHLLNAVEAVNARQKGHLFELVGRHYAGAVAGKTFAIWGLAFKPNTDDMREAPSRRLMEQLWEAGAKVRAFDPEATGEARRIYGERGDLVLCGSEYEALEGADALVLVTEWKQFRSPDFRRIREAVGDAVVFDGRNVYDPEQVERAGLAYYAIGRGRSLRGPGAVKA
ncbi:UDP-glucose/GDP-mannose dehydrogenase family protein [Lysobacter sp. GX 14042]|uniref:UDP-glucose dehydrogenase family protein n=1 Tax=Lysobacter sp. GX 14042 TaxID=2907155 RepID=UPI001F357946|nr:UDP-glucose/GDP-mannose dehydrogenase family protein [Lysobacter sp. GX 14042]MCE7031266.1 UDP-glucose/GDP-mannose dehydrogenase family protein [Lysobacter sp. GX 14042]